MSGLEFSNLHGFVQEVPLDAYERITSNYVDKLSAVDAVHGIVQIGSVSCPGLSDIDIVVIIDDAAPAPAWEEISFKDVAEADPHGSIVAHDIFVVTREIADSIGAFFYVDNQTVLRGKGLSSTPSSAISPYLADFITFEYACHRLESLFKVLASPTVDLRTALLLVSTLRHTTDLATELGILEEEAARQLKASIEQLRRDCVGVEDCSEQLDGWPERCLNLLWSVVVDLGDRFLQGESGDLKRLWAAGPKQSVLDLDAKRAPTELWERFVSRHKRSPLGWRVKLIPMPVHYHRHVALYLGEESEAAGQMRIRFPGVGSLVEESGIHSPMRTLRMGLVDQHWAFVNARGYNLCSGKGYFGLNKPMPDGIKKTLYSAATYVYSSHLSSIFGPKC